MKPDKSKVVLLSDGRQTFHIYADDLDFFKQWTRAHNARTEDASHLFLSRFETMPMKRLWKPLFMCPICGHVIDDEFANYCDLCGQSLTRPKE